MVEEHMNNRMVKRWNWMQLPFITDLFCTEACFVEAIVSDGDEMTILMNRCSYNIEFIT